MKFRCRRCSIPLRILLGQIVLAMLFGCVRPSAADEKLWEKVSGQNALRHVQVLVDYGPRPPQSDALEKSRKYIQQKLGDSGWETSRQTFTDETPRGLITFVNLIARFRGSKNVPSLLLCSHYDTKIFDDIRFVGANDGGSSTGLLIELARVLSQNPDLAGDVELVFFDGEEAVENFSDTDGLYGSRYFARELSRIGSARQFRHGLLLDMVGDRSLGITLPVDSPPNMARDLFAAAEALQCRDRFTYFAQGSITDDHTPLNAIGIPTIDVIDFDYAPWHTADDTMDKLSGESLQTVGRVVIHYISKHQSR